MESNFIISGFADEISKDFQEQLTEVTKLNMGYIEIRGVNGTNISELSLEEVKKVKSQLDEAGVKISAVGSPIGKITMQDDFQAHFQLFKHVVEIAKLLDTKYIRLFSFYMEQSEAEQYRDEVIRRLKMMTDYVEGTDIILLHENEKGIFGDVPERCLDIAKSIDSPNLKLIFDPANYVQCKVKTYPHAFEMLKDYVVYMHIKDAIEETGVVVPSGLGSGGLRPILKELKQANYQGFLSLEPHLGSFAGFAELEETEDTFAEASDINKFKIAHEHLVKILEEI